MSVNLPRYGVICLYQFPVYQSREEYEKLTGKPCPEWQSDKNPKYWEDVEAQENFEFAAKTTLNGEVTGEQSKKLVLYPQVLAVSAKTGEALKGIDGKPYLAPLWVGLETARSVNIPPKEKLGSGELGVPVPTPCRALEEGESLDWLDDAKTMPIVRNELYEAAMPAMFTRADKEMLYKIAAKVGVL